MNLDEIEQSIFQGTEGVEKALSVMKSFLEKNNFGADKDTRLVVQYLDIKTKSKTIPPLFINRVHVNEKFRFYIRSGIPVAGKVIDPRAEAIRIIEIALADINTRILSSTEPTVRRNREFEKNEIMKFFNENSNSVVALYTLYNMMLDFKDNINNS